MDKTFLAEELQQKYIDLLSAGRSVNQIWEGMADYVANLKADL